MSLKATIGACFNSLTAPIGRKINKPFGTNHEQ
jgi:hypothetical protein